MANQPKLNQILAIEEGAKRQEYADLSKTHHVLQKTALFNGWNREYTPKIDGGTQYPAEKQVVQANARDILKRAIQHQIELWNVIATKDWGNTEAKGTVSIGEDVIAADVPVSHLLYLEKQMNNIRTFISKLPVLDPAKEWHYDENSGTYRTEATKQIKTHKVYKGITKHEGNEHHPPQTELVTVDEPEGEYTRIDISTAYPADEVRDMLDRCALLEQALKTAREEANSIPVEKKKIGESVLGYIFQK